MARVITPEKKQLLLAYKKAMRDLETDYRITQAVMRKDLEERLEKLDGKD